MYVAQLTSNICSDESYRCFSFSLAFSEWLLTQPCVNCGEIGHLIAECPEPEQTEAGKQAQAAYEERKEERNGEKAG